MSISKKLGITDKERRSLLDNINVRIEFDSREGILEEEDLELQHLLADLELLGSKQTNKLTKKQLYSLTLSQLMQEFRELYPNETYDPGYGCRTLNQRIKAYADIIYNHQE